MPEHLDPKTPLTNVRGSVDSERYRAARVSKRFRCKK
jgi:hypothetical protein